LADFLIKNNFAKLGHDGFKIKEVREFLMKQYGDGNSSRVNALKRYFHRLFVRFKKERPSIDISTSDAFTGSKRSFGIYVKQASIMQKIITAITQLEGIAWAKISKDVYWGPYVNRAPNILVCPDYNRGYTLHANSIYNKIIVRRKVIDHHPYGVFIVCDKNKSFTFDGVPKIISQRIVTPLIMHLLELPISRAADDIHILCAIVGDSLKLIKEYILRWFSRRVIFNIL